MPVYGLSGGDGPTRAVAGCLLAAALLAGCGSGTTAPRAGVPAAEVRADATQTRFDEVAVRRFEITVTNTGREPFTVSAVRLSSPGFAPAEVLPREDEFPPSIRYDLPALYGEPRCGTSPVPAYALVTVRRASGRASTVRVPLHSEDGLLRALQSAECDRLQLAREVDVRLADAVQDGPLARAVVRVRRLTTTAAVTVTELRDSKLFTFTLVPAAGGGAALPAVLAPAATTLDVPVTVTAAACYGHLLADVKQPYLFPVFLRFDGGPPRYAELATDDAQHATLQAVLRTACAGRTD